MKVRNASGLANVRVVGVLVVGSCLACSSSDDSPYSVGGPSPSRDEGATAADDSDAEPEQDHAATYHRDLRPVVESSCFPCHEAENIGPFTLESFDDLVFNVDAVVAAVREGIMPPWYADDDCHPLEDSRRLSEETRELFATWRDDGFPEGDPDDYVAPRQKAGPEALGEPTLTVSMPEAYATYHPGPGGEDEQRCFLLPARFEEEAFVKALSVRPQTRTVHHLQVHRIPAGSIAEAEAADAAAPGPGYPCFGGAASGSYNLYSWHPGSEVVSYGEGEAQYLPAGTRLALQIHFNVDFLTPDDAIPEEVTSLDLWTLPADQPPDHVIVRFFLAGSSFSDPLNIPPGNPHVIAEEDNLMGLASTPGGVFVPGELVGHTPHMHYLGVGYNVTLVRETGESQCLVDLPSWDFDWQLDYWYPRDRYVSFGPTDVVNVRCDFDNSPANQPFIGGQQRTPQQVYFGQSSSDEMCLNHTWVRYEREAYLAALNGTSGS